MKLSPKASFGLALLASLITARADVLSSYTFTGSLRTSSDTDPFSTASSITDGAGWTSIIDTAHGNAAPSLGVSTDQTDATSQGAAVTANDYYTFTLTPLAGYSLNLTSFTFDYANATTDGTYPTVNFFVRSSIDSFGSNLAGAVSAAAGSAGAFANTSIPLSAMAYQGLISAIEFRLYVYDSTTDADRSALVDNVTVNGTTSLVPEPSAALSLIGGFGLLAGLRRRR